MQRMETTKNSRSSLLVKNVIASFILKGWSAIVVLLMVPLTLEMLGEYNNGVWLTISSVLIWINLMDIGLGNGLRNMVTNMIAIGDNEKVKEAISSTFFMLVIIVIPTLLLLCTIIWKFDIYSSFGIDATIVPDLKRILTIAIVLTANTFILKAVGNFYMGMQLPAVNNLIVGLGQTFSLLFTFLAYIAGSRSLFVVVLINTIVPFCVWLMSYPYTFIIKYPQYRPSLKYISLQMSQSLCAKGVQFFVLQFCGVILFSTTNIVISKIFSPIEVTPYHVAYRYFNIMFVVFSTICMPFWNATTDAYAKGDVEWIHKTGRKLDFLMLTVFIALTMMVIVSDYIYDIWLITDVYIPKKLSAITALYVFILILSQRYSFILNGLNVLRIQLVFTTIATVVYLPLALYVCKLFGTVTSLVCVMCLVNTPGLIANFWKYNQVIYKQIK